MRNGFAVATLFACVTLGATTSAAQFPRGGRGVGSDPDYWVGVDYGYQGGMNVYDATGAQWAIGYTSQLRATAAKTIAPQISIGVAAGFSTPTLTYYPGSAGTGNSFSCSFGCTAKADVTQWLAFLHYGSGLGFHGVYSLEAGITQFGNFREESTGDVLPPSNSSNDFSFGLGGGAGYGFSKTMDGYIAENFDIVLHSQGANVGGDAPRFFTFRVGFRAGF